MRAMWQILRLIWRTQRRAMRRGAALAVLVAISGIALLALSGWFIVAAGMAGLAGAGAVFDVFRPSAGVRFLAIARTGSRYAERILTHDATLRALAELRVRLLAGLTQADFAHQSRLRGGQALNRVTADVDALDGMAIRLAFPALAGAIAAGATGIALAVLVAPVVALWVIGVQVGGAAVVLALAARSALAPAARAEAHAQALRAGVIGHLRGRATLAVAGGLPASHDRVMAEDRAARHAALRQARAEWRAAAALQGVAAVALAGSLWLAGDMARDGLLGAPQVALSVFAALATTELAAGLLRGVAEIGRMRDAAMRVAPMLGDPHCPLPPLPEGIGLHLDAVSAAPQAGLPAVVTQLSLTVNPGEMVALTGVSGRGKSALLNTIAGLVPPVAGRVRAGGRIGYLTQRPVLLAGTVAETLRLAAPLADAAQILEVLARVALDVPPDLALGEGGAGLSGGQTRRLALARVLIQRPDVLLLDEPTEGLDAPTAEAVLRGIRQYLPHAAILIAAHRPAERRLADRVIAL